MSELSVSRREMLVSATAVVAIGSGLAGVNARSSLAEEAKKSSDPTLEWHGPGFYRFKVGTIEALSVSDGVFPLGQPFKDYIYDAEKKDVEQALSRAFLPLDRDVVDVNHLVVKIKGKTIVIDSGGGDNFGDVAGHLPANLKNAGIDPTIVDAVVITHIHPDHAFGNVRGDGSLVFPNAQYFVAAPEHKFWMAETVDLGSQPLDEGMKGLIIAGAQLQMGAVPKNKVTLFSNNQEILPGITTLFSPGHTPGHASFIISDGNDTLFHIGDVVHNTVTSFQYPDWKIAFDTISDLAVTTRKRILDQASADKMRVYNAHMPWPGLGRVVRQGSAYAFVQEHWSWTNS